MWARELFMSFIENDIKKENLLAKNVSQTSLESIKSVYKKRRKQGMTPFIVSILHDDVALCNQLIAEGIDFGQRSSALRFDEKSFNKFNDDATELITLGPHSNVFTDFKKTTPMYWAIKCDKLCLVDRLISSGHEINGPVEKLAGMPALSFALLSNNIAIAKLLLNRSCDIHQNSLLNIKPFDVAIRSGCEELVKFMLEHGENANCTEHQLSPLLQAIFLNNFLMVKLILSEGANVNGFETKNKLPPLILAIMRGHYEIACFLIAKGGDVNYKDTNGNTPLHLLLPHLTLQSATSINKPALKVAELLIEKGAKVDVANAKGEIPLLQAIYQQEPVLVDLFLSAPVDINTLLNLKPKATFLHFAVSPPVMFCSKRLVDITTKNYTKRRYSIAQSLIKKGADVNKESGDGRTALHFAAESGCVKLIELLLESKVDINKRSADGKVALHYAACNGSIEVINLMLKSDAEVNVVDKNGLMPLDCGILGNEHFSCDTAKLLIDYGADIYSHCVFKSFKTYDLAAAMVRPDLMKVFWREGHPYDLHIFLPTKDFPAALKSFFHRLKVKNVISLDLNKKMSKAKCKVMEELINEQSKFITGVERNSVTMVLGASHIGAEVAGSSMKVPSPLHFLAKKGFTDVALVLLSKGVKPNTVDSEGNIPVDLAVQFGHFKMYITLLQYGACYKRSGFDTKVFQKEGNGKNYEIYVLIKKAFKDVKRGNHCIFKSLKKYVKLKDWDVFLALINCVDEKGRTLMQVAMDRGHKDIVKKLMEYRLQAPDTNDLL